MSSLIVEVCKIEHIKKHPNADNLSIVKIKGWDCIVGLNQYKVGDLVVFVPPDCIIPQNIVEKYNLTYLKNDGRTGTIKLRGYISQGLVLDLPEGRSWKVGDDVSSVLGITKWLPPQSSGNDVVAKKTTSKKKPNPFFDKYTDIENIKNYPDIFKIGDEVVVLEKVHGSNARYGNLEIVFNKSQPIFYRLKSLIKKYIFKHDHEFVIGSHNVQIYSETKKNNFYNYDIWTAINKKYLLNKIVPKDCILYGEIFGRGIQDLEYGLNDIEFIVFDIKCRGKYLNWEDVKQFCEKNNLKHVPELYLGKYYDGLLEDYTSGKSLLFPSQIREGVVIKTAKEENHPLIGRKILKSISADYLLRKGNRTEFK